MKKKFLSFLFTLIFILPCFFLMAACGPDPDDGGKTPPPAGEMQITNGVFEGWRGDKSLSPEVLILPETVNAVIDDIVLPANVKELVVPSTVSSVVKRNGDNFIPVNADTLKLTSESNSLERITLTGNSNIFSVENSCLYSKSNGFLIAIFNTKNLTELTLNLNLVGEKFYSSFQNYSFNSLQRLNIFDTDQEVLGSYLNNSSLQSLSSLTVHTNSNNLNITNLNSLQNLIINGSGQIQVNTNSISSLTLEEGLSSVVFSNNNGNTVNVNLAESITRFDVQNGDVNIELPYSQFEFEFENKYSILGINDYEWRNFGFGISTDESEYNFQKFNAYYSLSFKEMTTSEVEAKTVLSNYKLYTVQSAENSEYGVKSIKLKGYWGTDSEVVVPRDINGYLVTEVDFSQYESGSEYSNVNFSSLILPSDIKKINISSETHLNYLEYKGSKANLIEIKNISVVKNQSNLTGVTCNDGIYSLLASGIKGKYIFNNQSDTYNVSYDEYGNLLLEVLYQGNEFTTHSMSANIYNGGSDTFNFDGFSVIVSYEYKDNLQIDIEPVISIDGSSEKINSTSKTEFIGVIEHDFEITYMEPSTCVNYGYIEKECKICSAYDSETLELAEHTPDIYGMCVNDNCEHSVYWEISGNTIYGITEEAENRQELFIPDGISSIQAIYRNESYKTLKSIYIPKSVIYFDTFLLYYCNLDAVELENIYYEGSISDWVKISFGYSSGMECYSNLLRIADKLFVNSTLSATGEMNGTFASENVVIDDSVEEISKYAFYGYKALKSITIPETVTTINENVFTESGLIKASVGSYIVDCLPSTIKELSILSNNNSDVLSFYYSPHISFPNLETITFAKCFNLLQVSFSGCEKLVNVYYDGTILEWLQNVSFDNENCVPYATHNKLEKNFYVKSGNSFSLVEGLVNLRSVSYEDLSQINNYAFYDYNKVTELQLNSNTVISELALYENTSIKEVWCSSESIFNLPNTVENLVLTDNTAITIPNNDISEERALKSVKIAVNIDNDNTNDIWIQRVGNYAFYNCPNLNNFDFSVVKEFGEYSFAGVKIDRLTLPIVTKLESYAFADSGLSELHITSDNVELLSLSYLDLKKATIPGEYLDSINDEIIEELVLTSGTTLNGSLSKYPNFNNLVSLTLPAELESIIGGYFFNTIPKLKKVYFTGSLKSWCELNIEPFSNIRANGQQTSSKATLFRTNTEFYINNELVENLVIDENSDITTINQFVFMNYNGLKSLTVNKDIVNIGFNSFYGCSNLTTVNANAHIGRIDASFNNSGVTKFDFTEYGLDSFNSFTDLINLVEFKVNPDVQVLHDYYVTSTTYRNTFNGCVKLTKYTGPTILANYLPENQIEEMTINGGNSFFINENLTGTGAGNKQHNIKKLAIEVVESITINSDYTNFEKLEELTISNSVKTINGMFGVSYPRTSKYKFVFDGSLEDWLKINVGYRYSNPAYHAHSVYVGGEEENNKITKATSLTIPEEITTIKSYAFYGWPMGKVVGHNNIESFETAAFAYCEELETIENLPLLNIVEQLFDNCSSLKNIDLSKTQTVGDNAFANCLSLETINFTDVLTDIGTYAFNGCKSLKELVIPKNANYSSNILYGCSNIRSLTIPHINDGFKYLFGNEEDVEPSLKDLILTNCSTLGSMSGASYLQTLSLPEGVTEIAPAILTHSNLYKLIINTTQTLNVKTSNIDNFKFGEKLVEIVNKAEAVTYNGKSDKNIFDLFEFNLIESDDNTKISKVNDFVFYDDGVKYLVAYAGNDSEVTLPDNFKSSAYEIYKHGFYSDPSIVSITISNGVKGIGENAFAYSEKLQTVNFGTGLEYLGSGAFDYCQLIENITTPANIAEISDQFTNMFSLKSITFSKDVQTVNPYVFSDYFTNLEEILVETGNSTLKAINNCLIKEKTIILGCKGSVIPNSNEVTAIGDYAFYRNLGDIEVNSDYITSVGFESFLYCENLKNVTLTNVLTISDSAFSGSAVEELDLGTKITTIGKNAFSGVNIESFVCPDSLVDIGEAAFMNCYNLQSFEFGTLIETLSKDLFNDCSNLLNVVLKTNIKSIGMSAFANCSSLIEIELPNSLLTLDYAAFSGSGLIEITLPETIIEVSSSLFADCLNLATINLSSQTTKLGNNVFAGCISIESIFLPNTISELGEGVFMGCELLSEINIPTALKTIGSSAFADCFSISTMDLTGAANLESIGEYAFANCSQLTEIKISSSTDSIGYSVFSGATSLENIVIPTLDTFVNYFGGEDYVPETLNRLEINNAYNFNINGYVFKYVKELVLPSIGSNTPYTMSQISESYKIEKIYLALIKCSYGIRYSNY